MALTHFECDPSVVIRTKLETKRNVTSIALMNMAVWYALQ
jgi:hypothetical protein